jgi:hypothetical protein
VGRISSCAVVVVVDGNHDSTTGGGGLKEKGGLKEAVWDGKYGFQSLRMVEAFLRVPIRTGTVGCFGEEENE